jgi:hypothetical protein
VEILFKKVGFSIETLTSCFCIAASRWPRTGQPRQAAVTVFSAYHKTGEEIVGHKKHYMLDIAIISTSTGVDP